MYTIQVGFLSPSDKIVYRVLYYHWPRSILAVLHAYMYMCMYSYTNPNPDCTRRKANMVYTTHIYTVPGTCTCKTTLCTGHPFVYVYHDNHAITFHNSCRETMCSGCNLRGTPPLTEGCGLQLLLVAPLHSLSLRYPQAESVAVATGPHPLSLCSFSWAGLS